MADEKRIIEEIYESPTEKLPELSSKAVNEALCMMEDYANRIIKKSDIMNNR